MTKGDLVAHISRNTGLSRTQASMALDSIVDGIKVGLRKDGSASLTGLGTFKMTRREARKGRNPKTGESINIPAKNVIKFRPTKGVEKSIYVSW